jgi:hypothetical protein
VTSLAGLLAPALDGGAVLAAIAFAAPVALAFALGGGAVLSVSALVLALELRRRAELVARAAHELRGPLTAAVLALHAARRAGLGGVARRAALDAVTEQLDRAVLAVGDLEPAAAGRVPGVRRTATDLRDLLEAQVAAWRPLAIARGRDVRLVAGTPRLSLAADHRLLRQALANVIANALDHGSGDVLLAARRRGRRLRIEVLDGPRSGCPPRVQPGVSSPLGARAASAARLDAVVVPPAGRLAAVRRAGRHRHGHGLRVAADVAARHGGRLLLARDDRGSVAILELPLPGGSPAAPARRRPRAAARRSGVRGARTA